MTVSEKMEGNKNAEKWDLARAEMFFDHILKYIQDEPKCRSLSEACVAIGEYEDLMNYLINKFPDTVFRSIKKAKDIVKNRLVQQGLDGVANPTMAIFILKNNHNFTDKQQTDHMNNGKDFQTPPTQIVFIDTKEDDED